MARPQVPSRGRTRKPASPRENVPRFVLQAELLPLGERPNRVRTAWPQAVRKARRKVEQGVQRQPARSRQPTLKEFPPPLLPFRPFRQGSRPSNEKPGAALCENIRAHRTAFRPVRLRSNSGASARRRSEVRLSLPSASVPIAVPVYPHQASQACAKPANIVHDLRHRGRREQPRQPPITRRPARRLWSRQTARRGPALPRWAA